ncbi:hypothetical protein [Streptomyces sp. NPDC051704]|uniref:hypothetical protein n=1 Tax=Streptomyces sp. NPDC051704 TaxID=3365671 RepID=UPI0037AB88D8
MPGVGLTHPLWIVGRGNYYAPGDAPAEGGVLRPQLGILVGMGMLGILLAHLALRRRDLAP